MLCIYYPISDVINKGNISNEERMELLESYSKCMNSNFKDLTKEAKDRRKDLQDILLNNLTFKSLDASSSLIEAGQTVCDKIVYDLCGYLLYARCSLIYKMTNNCEACLSSLVTKKQLLPETFYAGELVAVRERYGGLKYCTPNMFTLFTYVEKCLQEHLDSDQAYVRDSFSIVIEKISQLSLPSIACTMHREELIPRLIYEYVVFRYRFHAKQEKKIRIEKLQSKRKTLRKLSKLVPAPKAKGKNQNKKSSKEPVVLTTDPEILVETVSAVETASVETVSTVETVSVSVPVETISVPVKAKRGRPRTKGVAKSAVTVEPLRSSKRKKAKIVEEPTKKRKFSNSKAQE